MSGTLAGQAEPVPVVLVGARGHGRSHLENIRRLVALGRVRLVGVCDLAPLADAETAGLGEPAHSADLGVLLARTRPAAAVVCTPIHTHTELALTAVEHGVHLLLEKPPAPSFAQYLRLTEAVEKARVACQIGFQSLGSGALPAVRELVEDGAIGEVLGIGAAGAWVRDEAYFRRAPWAGRRRLDGADVVDGALTNPLAHAVATALALAGATGADDVAQVETELFRAHAIESDDTSWARVTTTRGDRVAVAATLCAAEPGEPYVVVHGTHGRVTLWYRQDRVRLDRTGHPPQERVHDRIDLLENLLDHLAGRAGLLAGIRTTGAFMRVVEAIRRAPDPVPLPPDAWYSPPGAPSRRVVRGIDGLVSAAAEQLCGYAELGAAWARPAPRDA
ncbi:Gfo/Idh/MocA family protein [Streptomyces sp. TS71-3]|uniref:Gfo/Idh/MocA family protein n=1 Tax=Streptomyces sp. TS71-3 TaxID=2733862 RepID=UPI001B0562DB|nr:Gfo/Idh/MocA family oxidoreductase [Streptomyces sp. TS71-3]GHJ38428.1 oxidoreductase [Streptomyces sp. TS71-3]